MSSARVKASLTLSCFARSSGNKLFQFKYLVLQCVAVCCSVLQCVTMRYSALQCCSMLQHAPVCCSGIEVWHFLVSPGRLEINSSNLNTLHCSVLQCVVVRCSVLQVCCSILQCVAVRQKFDTFLIRQIVWKYTLPIQIPCLAVCCSVLQCVAVCCSVLQCVAVCLPYMFNILDIS